MITQYVSGLFCFLDFSLAIISKVEEQKKNEKNKEEIAMCAKTVVISIEIQLAILPFHLKGSKFNIE